MERFRYGEMGFRARSDEFACRACSDESAEIYGIVTCDPADSLTRSSPDQGPSPSDGAGPLVGVRVIELGTLIAGPFAGRLLADMGAEVIKVEHPGRPDPLREWGQALYRGRSLWWAVQSRNKKCVTLDLGTEQGGVLLLELAKRSDVVLENFRPGTLEKWNFGFDRLSEANDRLILVRVTG